MQYLAFIIGAIAGFIIYLLYKKKTTKSCPYCAERIKKQAILCRYCGKSLTEKDKKSIINSNSVVHVAEIASLFVPKQAVIAKVVLTKGIKILLKK